MNGNLIQIVKVKVSLQLINEIDLKVESKDENCLYCKVLNDGVLGSRKSVNVPGVRINLPSLTEKDKTNILFAIENDLDFIAHSFVRNKHDLLDIQKILDEHNSPIKIISKIENQEGVDNIDEILFIDLMSLKDFPTEIIILHELTRLLQM